MFGVAADQHPGESRDFSEVMTERLEQTLAPLAFLTLLPFCIAYRLAGGKRRPATDGQPHNRSQRLDDLGLVIDLQWDARHPL